MASLDVVAPAGERRRERGAVLLAGEFTRTPPEDLILTLDALAECRTTVTVAVVAEPPGLLGLFLPLSGGACATELRRDLLREAAQRACALAHLAPSDLRVEHLAVGGWRELARHAQERSYDEVVVGEPPRRHVDRRLVRAAGWAMAG